MLQTNQETGKYESECAYAFRRIVRDGPEHFERDKKIKMKLICKNNVNNAPRMPLQISTLNIQYSTGKTSNHLPREVRLSIQTGWITPQKPTDLAERQLLSAILDGSFPVGSTLPPERELALALGITRPTLREALQRIARDGWIQIRQGKSTVVTDYWREGNLVMLNALSQQPEAFNNDFIDHLLQVRAALAPVYARLAVQNASEDVVNLLKPLTCLPDTPEAYAQADQELHHQLTLLSGNPIFTLIYNGFRQLSLQAGLKYFAVPETRKFSLDFYQGLLDDAQRRDAETAARRTSSVMTDSILYWQKSANS